jgi:hypothetical protein
VSNDSKSLLLEMRPAKGFGDECANGRNEQILRLMKFSPKQKAEIALSSFDAAIISFPKRQSLPYAAEIPET